MSDLPQPEDGFQPIELHAEQYRRSRVDVPHQLPVKIELYADLLPHVRIRSVIGLIHNCGLEACVVGSFMRPDKQILIDKRICDHPNPGLYHAALAEELGHIVLFPDQLARIDSVGDFLTWQDSAEWGIVEVSAKRWGRALRMPSKQFGDELQSIYAQAVSDLGFPSPEALHARVVGDMATRFASTADDVCYRLHEAPGNLRHHLARSIYGQRLDMHKPGPYLPDAEKKHG